MIFRPLLVVVALLTLGCRPNPFKPEVPPVPEPVRIWDVSPRGLHFAYMDASDKWTNQRIRVVIHPGDYVVAVTSIYWHANDPMEPQSIMFRCNEPTPDNSKTVTITGTVRGRVYDGHRRGSGAVWYVLVDNCEVKAR